ncbi:MAG: DUF1736 domain-containing protein [Candidatus Solibacter sp.]|nr:DUF1736 domain-containing protein [Candidatus Solibacter sp.]
MKDRKLGRARPGVTGMNAPLSRKPQLSGDPRPTAAWRSDRRTHGILIGLLLCVLALLVYSNSFRVPIIFDSKGLLLQDPRIRAATSENVALIFQHTYWWPWGEAGIYRPLTTLSYLFNYAILGDGDHAAGYHRVNLAMHMVNVLLVFAVSRKLLGQLGASALMAALWAVHPASTEAVTNIAGRPELLSATAVLGGFLMYVKSMEATGTGRIAWFLGLGTVTTAGVYSKENAVMIIGVIALYELARLGRRRWWDFLFACIATGIPIAGMLVQRASVLAGSAPAEFPFTDNPIADAGFWTGRLTALEVVAHYLVQAVWPWRLSIDYSYAQIPLANGGSGDWIWVAATLLAASGLVALRRWNRTAFFLAGFALIVLLPASNLLFPIGTIRADRFLYLPAVGLLGCVVMAAYTLGSRMRLPLLAPALILVMTAGFAVRTWGRNAEWRDEVTLASADVQTSPRSFKLHVLRATAMFSADPLHANIDRVVEEMDKSLAILHGLPDLRRAPETYYFAGVAYLAKGDRSQTAGVGDFQTAYRRSRELLESCIQINNAYERQREARYGKPAPGVVARTKPDAYLHLSMAYQRLGGMAGALRAAREAQRLAPLDFRMYRRRADLFLIRQQGDDAAVALIEGMLITSDLSLRSDLVRLYGSSTDPANCTLVPDPAGPAINQQCGIVREHMCAAAPGVLMALIDTGRRQEALETKQTFFDDYQCAPGPLNEVLQ